MKASDRPILLAGWIALVIYAYPGLVTQDSFDHLREVRSGIYTDAHPPMLVALWRGVELLVAGQTGLLLVNLTALLAGVYLVTRHAKLTVALVLFPPVLATMAVIWKDCTMAGFLALGIAGLLAERRAARVAGLAAIFLATAVRYNAFAATLPIVVLLFQWAPDHHRAKRYAIATATWLAITLAAFGANTALTDRPMHYWHSSLALYDIAGTLAYVDEELPDADLVALLGATELSSNEGIHQRIRRCYTTHDFYPLINDAGTVWTVPVTGTTPAPAPRRAAIERAWRETVSRYPGAYVKHRLSVMHALLATKGIIPSRGFSAPEVRELGLSTRASSVQQVMAKVMRAIAKYSPLFIPYIWVAAALAIGVLAIRRRHRLAIALVASGLVLESSLVVLAHSVDFRYSHWLVIATLVASVVLVRDRAARSAAAAAPPAT